MAICNSSELLPTNFSINTLADAEAYRANAEANIEKLRAYGRGRTDKPYSVIAVAANYTAVANTGSITYLAVPSAASPGALTITSPLAAELTAGDTYIIDDVSNNSDTYNITIARNSNTIDSAASNK